MGENDWSERIKLLKPYTVTMKMMQMTGTPDDQLIFMHCLPAFHDRTTQVGEEIYEKYGLNEMEVTDEVFNSKYAWQFTEAENRLHSIKAVMAATLGNLFIPIACGGGGIPVIVKDGHLRGVAGVIDKDFSTAKMAEDINADELVILTTVDHAFLNYGKENQQAIGKILCCTATRLSLAAKTWAISCFFPSLKIFIFITLLIINDCADSVC